MDFLKFLFPKSKAKIQKVQKLVNATQAKKVVAKKPAKVESRFDAAAELLDKDKSGYFLEPDESFDFDIVGESFYQDHLSSIAGPKSDNGVNFECDAVVSCDNKNQHDKNAIAVTIAGLLVGYFPKKDSKEWRHMLAANGAREKDVRVKAVISGGWLRKSKNKVDEGHYGVKLDIPTYSD